MKRALFALFAVAMLVSGVQLYAHHSFAATYHEDQSMKIDGTLVQFQFRNPHSFVQVDAMDSKGVMQRWGVEWGGAGQLGGQGINRYTLKVGDHVIITGNPGRNPDEHRMRMTGLKRPASGETPELSWGTKPGETFD
ncbi:MAG TPA: DUF6152 family protein [Terriglobia bacterium]|jgi:hypothetical protein